jgi:hypothetical protein
MTANRFMSEIAKYRKLSLGGTEQLFLVLFALHTYSAYELWSYLKNVKPMSYKNVHNKIKRLVVLGLIEEEKGNFKRNAIKYRLTSRGLFERLLLQSRVFHPTLWYNYKDNVILRTILYRYFETQTIWKFREPKYTVMSALVTNYLRKCCEAILTNLEFSRETDIDQLIRNELRDLLLKIISLSSIDKQEFDKIQSGEEMPRVFPYPTLRRDNKFMALLKEMKTDFDRGCKKFGL